ncbi:4a-hydroxytetrahydrobiopterin dehydratase [Methanofollis fontis]|uniref:4a-hydroxytetrahydrobiopterin dehydratase n=1 Tax=Methanofollis fontis TaxID=2052832 RepID=A0A483CZ74_9EURY|nr:4a-hydroxytetrahydrobiopterin dehydratase [Methanofollis fontis]TAJ45319.1 4a-hydroxytetrahydrobiopterin dehydratase [Methanofollis fontis]
MPLTSEVAQPIVPGAAPLTRREIMDLLPEVPGWDFKNGRLNRQFTFESVSEAIAFINEIIALGSESAEHYPDICLSNYRHVEVSWYTHASGGLTRTDLILAARLNNLIQKNGIMKASQTA